MYCRTFCGGEACSHESASNCRSPAIAGLHSSWVTDDVVASCRLSSRKIAELDLVSVFRERGIGAVFNLQQPGEHAHCGDGLCGAGFSYDPCELMDAGVRYYNFGWKDLGVPSMQLLLNIAQVMQDAQRQGMRMLVHCHAGLGRTGLVVAAFLVYAHGISPDGAVAHVRERRPRALQTKQQVAAVHRFSAMLDRARIIFPDGGAPASVADMLLFGQTFLHGEQGRLFRHTPVAFERLCALMARRASLPGVDATAELASACAPGVWVAAGAVEQRALALATDALNAGEWHALELFAPRITLCCVVLLLQTVLAEALHPIAAVEADLAAYAAPPAAAANEWRCVRAPMDRAVAACLASLADAAAAVHALAGVALMQAAAPGVRWGDYAPQAASALAAHLEACARARCATRALSASVSAVVACANDDEGAAAGDELVWEDDADEPAAAACADEAPRPDGNAS